MALKGHFRNFSLKHFSSAISHKHFYFCERGKFFVSIISSGSDTCVFPFLMYGAHTESDYGSIAYVHDPAVYLIVLIYSYDIYYYLYIYFNIYIYE